MLKEQIKQTEVGFKLEGKIVGNPDHHQYFKPMKLSFIAPTLQDLKARQRQFIDESFKGISSDFPIGGGNWSKFKVYDPKGVLIGEMSYNGRIWNANKQEVLIP